MQKAGGKMNGRSSTSFLSNYNLTFVVESKEPLKFVLYRQIVSTPLNCVIPKSNCGC